MIVSVKHGYIRLEQQNVALVQVTILLEVTCHSVKKTDIIFICQTCTSYSIAKTRNENWYWNC